VTKLYVGNLPYSTTADDLNQLFADYGPVVSSTIISDKATGRSKGFGFVELEDDSKAQDAIAKLNGTDFSGRPLNINVARPMREDR